MILLDVLTYLARILFVTIGSMVWITLAGLTALRVMDWARGRAS